MRSYIQFPNEQKLINHVSGLRNFIEQWDTPPAITPRTVKLKKSNKGNINLEGSPNCDTASIFTRWHPNFWTSIEPGVKELVSVCVLDLNCITYSSCEGHTLGSDSSDYLLMYISLVPRNADEYNKLSSVFELISTHINDNIGSNSPIKVEVSHNFVTSDHHEKFKAFDVIFGSLTSKSINYFSNLDDVNSLLCSSLRLYTAGTAIDG